MSEYFLPATPDTVHWGRFWSELPPVMEVPSGSTVRIETFSGREAQLPAEGSGLTVSDAHRAVLAADLPRVAHLLTGPLAIQGAKPGDVLEICIDAVDLGADWGFNTLRPSAGTLMGELPVSEAALSIIPIDRAANTARLSWGAVLPLAPFFGVMGVAPPPAWGELTSVQPRMHGGNIDLKLLTAGSTLWLPVHTEGALFSCGDGHAVQGDGEVCITALETSLTGTFTFKLHEKGALALDHPMAGTADEYITLGFHASLDEALKIALRQMITLISRECGITQGEAYQFCSMAVDFAVTQSVNGEKGIHGRVKKSLLRRG